MSNFDPRPYFIKVSGKDYLPVAMRLVWLHERFPSSSITTELVKITDDTAIVRAEVSIRRDDGSVSVFSGYKSCPMNGKFPAIEKAETGAIGRALAHAGLGTQFAGEDVDEGLEDGQLADSPVQFTPHPQSRPARDVRPHEPAVPAAARTTPSDDIEGFRDEEPQRSPADILTPKQLGKIKALARDLGWEPAQGRQAIKDMFGKDSTTELTLAEASKLIDHMIAQVPQEQQVLANV